MMGLLFADPARVPSNDYCILSDFNDLSVTEASDDNHDDGLNDSSGNSSGHEEGGRGSFTRRTPRRTKSDYDGSSRSRGRGSAGNSKRRTASKSPIRPRVRRGRSNNNLGGEASNMTDHLEDIAAFCQVMKAVGSAKRSELISDQLKANNKKRSDRRKKERNSGGGAGLA